jgi:hypothetical protein
MPRQSRSGATSPIAGSSRFPDLAREILRAFRYGRALSLLTLDAVYPKGTTPTKSVDTVIDFFISHLRNTDFVLESDTSRLLLLLPETTEEGGAILARRLLDLYAKSPVSSKAATPEVYAGISSIGIGGHTDQDLLGTSRITGRAGQITGQPILTLESLLNQTVTLQDWIALYATLTENEVLIMARVFERVLKEPFGFMSKLAFQTEQIAERLSLDQDDREALSFWIYAMDIPRFARSEGPAANESPAFTSRRRKLLYQKGIELFRPVTKTEWRQSKTRWSSNLAPAVFRAAVRIRRFFGEEKDFSVPTFQSFIEEFPPQEVPAPVKNLLVRTVPSDWAPFRKDLR